jgi:hypothetical protein
VSLDDPKQALSSSLHRWDERALGVHFQSNSDSRLRCAFISPAGGGELGQAVADGFAWAGCDVREWSPQAGWDANLSDLIVTYGPMHSLIPSIVALRQSIRRPVPTFVWFTEQVPRLGMPDLALRVAARTRFLVEERLTTLPAFHVAVASNQIGRMLSRAGRLRALGEMLILRQHGMLRLIGALSETNAQFLRRHGLPAQQIPVGYHPLFGERLAVSRDIDVVFLGSTRDRRRRHLIDTLEEQLVSKAVRVVVKDGSATRGGVFGKDRTLLLNRSKIMLNIMRQPWDDPVFRLLLAAPNGAMLLSEKLMPASTGLFRPNIHFAESDLADIVDMVRFYLDNVSGRERIAETAREFVTTELTIEKMAGVALRELGFAL